MYDAYCWKCRVNQRNKQKYSLFLLRKRVCAGCSHSQALVQLETESESWSAQWEFSKAQNQQNIQDFYSINFLRLKKKKVVKNR